MDKKTLREIDVSNKRILIRVDFNVPLNEKGIITDDSRITAALPTIQYALERNARVILISHLGRPKGQKVPALSLAPVAIKLAQLIGHPVIMAADSIGDEVEKQIAMLKAGNILLLENIRFHVEEEKNDPVFARKLANLGDIYINDAFGTAHRSHASISGITKYLPSVAGFLLEKEIDSLGHILENPKSPCVAVLGGAKVSDKIKLIKNLLDKVNAVIVGGGMAANFLLAKGYEVGNSLLEDDSSELVKNLMSEMKQHDIQLLLPIDVVVADEVKPDALTETVSIANIPADKKIVDIGPESIKIIKALLEQSRTVFWNGPMGIYEIPIFANGTIALAKIIAGLSATTIIGGGSTAEMVSDLGLADKMSFVSTGGGASLSFLGGEKLPGVETLLDK